MGCMRSNRVRVLQKSSSISLVNCLIVRCVPHYNHLILKISVQVSENLLVLNKMFLLVDLQSWNMFLHYFFIFHIYHRYLHILYIHWTQVNNRHLWGLLIQANKPLSSLNLNINSLFVILILFLWIVKNIVNTKRRCRFSTWKYCLVRC